MSMDSRSVEIVAPAGDEACAEAAINAGADAIYLGLRSFSARDAARNFDARGLESICRLARAFGVRVYVALNTVVKDGELDAFEDSLLECIEAGADAVILQDMLLGSVVKDAYPELRLHLSTQAGVCNADGALAASHAGFSRVIAARETSLDDLRAVSDTMECEAFVQGALCTCFSGQCYFSSFVGSNSGNRGRCKQPCRKRYRWDRDGFDSLAYRLSPSDLCVGEDICRYIEAGVTSLKIEGRLRRPEYVSAAVSYYRKLLDGTAGAGDFSALSRTYNRGDYTRGLSFGQVKGFLSPSVQGHIGESVGKVMKKDGRYICSSLEARGPGDGFKILRGGEEVGGAVFNGTVPGGFVLESRCGLREGDDVRITTDARLEERLLSARRLIPVDVCVRLCPGERACVSVNGRFTYGDTLPEAGSRPVTHDDVERCFHKTGGYPFDVTVRSECGNAFIAVSALNELRRRALAGFWEGLTHGGRNAEKVRLSYGKAAGSNRKTAVICRDFSGLRCDIGILKPDSYDDMPDVSASGFGGERFIYLPAFLGGEATRRIEPMISSFDGIYCDGPYGLELSERLGMPLFAGTGFNVTNSAALSALKAKYVALSKELTRSEAERLASGNTFYLTAGDLKMMDLAYCPFEMECPSCDMRGRYVLTDEDGRRFPVRRYIARGCRFEVYNCDILVTRNDFTGRLFDCTLCDAGKLLSVCESDDMMKRTFPDHTSGHFSNPVK